MYMSKTAARLSGIALVFFMYYAYYQGTQHEPLPQWLGYTLMALFFVFAILSRYVHNKDKKAPTTREH
jgi:hypothetical protein